MRVQSGETSFQIRFVSIVSRQMKRNAHLRGAAGLTGAAQCALTDGGQMQRGPSARRASLGLKQEGNPDTHTAWMKLEDVSQTRMCSTQVRSLGSQSRDRQRTVGAGAGGAEGRVHD